MTFRIVTPDERIATAKTTFAIFGPAKVGKTSLVRTLDPEVTLFANLEAGMKSVQDWRGPSIDINTWEDATDAACFFGGIDENAKAGQYYSPDHYQFVMEKYGKTINPAWFSNLFWDSVTDLTRLAMTWARTQPAAFSAKTGKPDLRGAYGLMGIEVIRLLKHTQRTKGKNVIFVGGLDHYFDERGYEIFEPQSEGNKAKSELPFIVDQVITMSYFDWIPGQGFSHNFGKGQVRALCCKSPNPWNLPAGDRSGKLELVEEPHLGKILARLNTA